MTTGDRELLQSGGEDEGEGVGVEEDDSTSLDIPPIPRRRQCTHAQHWRNGASNGVRPPPPLAAKTTEWCC